jgi:hypothetical protein
MLQLRRKQRKKNKMKIDCEFKTRKAAIAYLTLRGFYKIGVYCEFKTRKAAIAYLTLRGFYKIGVSLGDTVMKNPKLPNMQQYRVITQYNNGTWRIRLFEPMLVEAKLCFQS